MNDGGMPKGHSSQLEMIKCGTHKHKKTVTLTGSQVVN